MSQSLVSCDCGGIYNKVGRFNASHKNYKAALLEVF
jgi:hypothetical protein